MNTDTGGSEAGAIRLSVAAKRCGISLQLFRSLIERGEGPPVVKLSPRVAVVDQDDLRRWFESRKAQIVTFGRDK